jgi:hypothetical protein
MENIYRELEIKSEVEKEANFSSFLEREALNFLGQQQGSLKKEDVEETIKEMVDLEPVIKEGFEIKKDKTANYDKYKKTFSVGEEKEVGLGDIVSARRWGIEVSLPKDLENSGDGKKVRKLMFEAKAKDALFHKLNKKLATELSLKTQRQDALLSRAYSKIAERLSEENQPENKQTGVFAEQIIIGVLEGLSINHPQLGFTVTESNAYEDVQDKIDFIISTKQKKRGVGVNREDINQENKIIGIQLTTNISANEHKQEQIARAKVRGVEVDDIVYVEIKKDLLEKAIRQWEDSGKKISGPWVYLSEEVRTKTISSLLSGILDDEQERMLQKIITKK